MKIMIRAALHNLTFGEMAGLKLVPYIATHVIKTSMAIYCVERVL